MAKVGDRVKVEKLNGSNRAFEVLEVGQPYGAGMGDYYRLSVVGWVNASWVDEPKGQNHEDERIEAVFAEVLRVAGNTWDQNSGCWIGDAGFCAAGRVAAWLADHGIGTIVEATGPAGDAEVRLRYLEWGPEYWWPNSTDEAGLLAELERAVAR